MNGTRLTWPDLEAQLARAREVVAAGSVKVTAAETPNAFVIANGGGAACTVHFGQATPNGLGTCTCDDCAVPRPQGVGSSNAAARV